MNYGHYPMAYSTSMPPPQYMNPYGPFYGYEPMAYPTYSYPYIDPQSQTKNIQLMNAKIAADEQASRVQEKINQIKQKLHA